MTRLSNYGAIYLQIQKHFEEDIASGRIKPGEKIDPIRTLAQRFKVNPNTIQKSLAELERNGLIYTDRTNGKFVTEDIEIINELKISLIQELVDNFMDSVIRLDFSKNETLELLKKSWEVD